MGTHHADMNFEPAIWARLIRTPEEPISPEAARYFLSIDFSDADHSRMQLLMDKSNEGTLATEEEAELDGYVNVANVLSVIHSQARGALRNAGVGPSRDARHS